MRWSGYDGERFVVAVAAPINIQDHVGVAKSIPLH
jgi:hypothetical protein